MALQLVAIAIALFGAVALENESAHASRYPTYELTDVREDSGVTRGLLVLRDAGLEPFGPSLPLLSLQVFAETDEVVHVRITDAEKERWDPDHYQQRHDARKPHYTVELHREPFSFSVLRHGESLFDSRGASGSPALYFADLYMELSTKLPRHPNIYGLGERVTSFRLDPEDTRYTIWALAQDCIYDTGRESRGRNMYGHHPFYLEMRHGQAHGVYMHNINAMDVVFSEGRLTYRIVGGELDVYFFLGPTPQAVIQQYHSVIGAPMLPPFWALGYHQCRWGYNTLSALQEVVQGYDTYDIPLDVLWTDIDYMHMFEDFTLDGSRYPLEGFKDLLTELHAKNRRYVPIVDAGVKYLPGYFAYETGKAMDVFIKRRANSTEDFLGLVWPGKSVFVDWFHPRAQDYWSAMLAKLHESVSFDGVWIDMNEASSFCDGECPGFYSTPEEHVALPYTPGNHSLEDQVLPLLAKQYGSPLHIVLNTHGTFGTMETQATNHFLAEKFGERPFVLSRSSRAGHGQWGFHWLGDNWSLWPQMRESITGVFNFQFFGVSLVGADICGFHNNTSVELCSRWLQLGSLYPFMRNHNDIGWHGQELYALGPELMARGKRAIHLRYSLSSYIYTNLFLFGTPHDHNSGPYFRPLLYDFPHYEETYDNQEQVMLGPALLFNPVLYEGSTHVRAFIPPSEVWYDYFSGRKLPREEWQRFRVDLDSISLLLRGGRTLSYQDAEGALTITEMRARPLHFKVALSRDGRSAGLLIADDGRSLTTLQNETYSKYEVTTECSRRMCHIRIRRTHSGFRSATEYAHLGRIDVVGLRSHRVTGAALQEKELRHAWSGPVLTIFVDEPLKRTMHIKVRFQQ